MSDFFAMGGYGYFVWMSYGVTALCMVVEVAALLLGRQTVIKRLTRLARAEARKASLEKE
jgi:heme exporter protein D